MNEKKFEQIKEILKMWENSRWSHIDIFEYNAEIYKFALQAITNSKRQIRRRISP